MGFKLKYGQTYLFPYETKWFYWYTIILTEPFFLLQLIIYALNHNLTKTSDIYQLNVPKCNGIEN